MKQVVEFLATRGASAVASSLITYGVSSQHADAIAAGVAALVIVGVDAAIKWYNNRKGA